MRGDNWTWLRRSAAKAAVVFVAALLSATFSSYSGAQAPQKVRPEIEAQEAFARRDFDRALVLLQPLAELGDAKAQRMLGRLFLEGWGVEKNTQPAFHWMSKAAAQGDSEGSVYPWADVRTRR